MNKKSLDQRPCGILKDRGHVLAKLFRTGVNLDQDEERETVAGRGLFKQTGDEPAIERRQRGARKHLASINIAS